MKYYETEDRQYIGLDFYLDIGLRVRTARENLGWNRETLAGKAKMSVSRLGNIENGRVRITLDILETLSKTLDVTVPWLIDEKPDSQIGDCLYLIWVDKHEDFKLYKYAKSKTMAYLLFEQSLIKELKAFFRPTDRFWVELVGVPVTDEEIKNEYSGNASQKPDENGDFPVE